MTNNFTNLSNIATAQSNEDQNSDYYYASDSNDTWSPSSPIHGQNLTPRSRQTSPGPSSFESFPTRFGNTNKHFSSSSSSISRMMMMTRKKAAKVWYRRPVNVGVILLVGFFFSVNWWMLSRIQNSGQGPSLKFRFLKANSTTLSIREEMIKLGKGNRKPQKTIYARLLAKAAHALAERHFKIEPKDLWEEPYAVASAWKPCSEKRSWEPSDGNNGYILVSANGGINQQRVAVRSAMLLLLLDCLMQLLLFPISCTVASGEM